jgi:GTP-binding protein
VLEVDPNLHTLLDFRYRAQWKAERGAHGGGSGRTGRSGEDVIVRVPTGTEVQDPVTGETLADLVTSGQRWVVARGGRGGRGNQHFATPTHQSPQTAEDGQPGQSREVRLTLKLIADVGLVGFPNAGKSTLLASVTAARPKIADYPFTTLVPNLGIVKVGEYGSFVMADIPGLIEGAGNGKGLGYQFLRHIERTRVLLFLIDCLDPEPDRTLDILRGELTQYAADLIQKPYLVALTKTDLLPPKAAPPGISRLSVKPFMISAPAQRGLSELLEELYRLVRATSESA